MSIDQAVVLAAGKGTRLGALTADRPKPMVPLLEKPVLEHILLALRDVGIRRFCVVIGYKGEAIRSHFRDGSHLGVEIEYVEQPVLNGTGGAVILGREFAGDRPFLMSFGDIVTDQNHHRLLLEEYNRSPCAAVLGINPVDDPAAGGAVYREGNRVTRVVEKPPPGTAGSNWNLAGINIFQPPIFDALTGLPPSPRGEVEITDAIQQLITHGMEVRAVELHGFWSDVGTPAALAEAERVMGRAG